MKEIIAKPSITKEILDKYELYATKKFGQNFLIDPNIVSKIAKSACDKDTTTIEIGPGIGSLTQFLSFESKKVYAHEIDKKLIAALAEIFAEEDNIEIIPGDFLEVDFKDMPYFNDEVVICANLPYYITTVILFKLFESNLKIKNITVMVQKEVADRFLANKNSEDYNALSVIVAYKYDVKHIMKVSKNVFNPAPRVDSAVISFIPKDNKYPLDEKKFNELVKLSFTQRRKTLKNNLLHTYPNIDIILKNLSLKDNIRPQELSLEDYIRLYKEIYES